MPRAPKRTLVPTGLFVAMLAAAAPAAVDLTGVYRVRIDNPLLSPPVLYCSVTAAQTGTALSVSGTCDFVGSISASGTVDTLTGAFTMTGQAGILCNTPGSLTMAGTGDGTTFSGTIDCFISATMFGSTCGNGLPDPGEQCEDGNFDDGDCCSSTCQLDPPSTPCADDGQVCTDDVCDSAGACTHPPNTAPCEDGSSCSQGDTCAGGVCVGGAPLDAGTPCNDDDDLCTIDACDGAGACVETGTLTCDACSFCYRYTGCAGDPFLCTSPAGPSAKLTVRTRDPDTRDVASWSWGKGAATAVADFGNPPVSTDYLFCAYAWSTALQHYQTVALATLPAGASWTPTATGFRYADDSVRAVLKSGDEGKAKIKVKAKGPGLGAPASFAGLQETFIAQLRAVDGACWGATFADPPLQLSPILVKARNGQ